MALNGLMYTIDDFKAYYEGNWFRYWDQATTETVDNGVANSQDNIRVPPGLTAAPQPSPTTDFHDSSISGVPPRDIWDVPFFNLLLPKRISELEASVF